MKISFYLIIPAVFLVHLNVFAEGSCGIDNGQTPALAKYEYEVNTLLGQLKQKPSSCGGTRSNGVISNTRRTVDVLNKAKTEIPMMGDITLDFNYNIQTAFKGESRAAVIENGKVFARIERALTSTLDVLGSKCNIDENETTIIKLIRTNHALESLYKNTALGYPGNDPGDIPDEYKYVASEIQNTYNPKATEGCKNEFSWEKMSKDIMDKIGSIGGGIEKGLTDWKYAIALIRGGKAVGEEKYTATKKQLLTEELRRQGLSAGAIDQMVKNLSCVEDATKDKNNPIDVALAKGKCMSMGFLGVARDRFMKQWESLPKQAKTTDSRIAQTKSYNQLKATSTNAVDVYNGLQTIFTESVDTDDEMLTKLIALHINLLSMNERVEKRIPPMLENCRKILSEVSCNF